MRTARLAIAITMVGTLLVPAAPAAAATPRRGQYHGEVAAGYGAPQFQLTVANGRVKDVVARMFWSCNGQPVTQWVVVPLRKFKVRDNGTFSGKDTYSTTGWHEEIWVKGTFVTRNKVRGTIRAKGYGGGETCDTQERRFTAVRQ